MTVKELISELECYPDNYEIDAGIYFSEEKECEVYKLQIGELKEKKIGELITESVFTIERLIEL